MLERVKLGSLITIKRGVTYKSAMLGADGPVLLGLGSLRRHGGFRSDALKRYSGDSPESLLVRPGELYASLKDVTQTADLLGAVALIPADGPTGRLTQDTVRIDLRPGEERIDLKYLHWILRTPEYRAYCAAHATGTTTMGLAREEFLSFEVPLPDPRRSKIAVVLGALDDKIAANDRLASIANDTAGLMFDRGVASVAPVAMSSAVDLVSGGTPKRDDVTLWGGDVPWASVRDITAARWGVLLTTAESITQLGASKTRTAPLPAGSVLISARGTVGEVARLATAASFNQSSYGFIPGRLPSGVLYFAVLRASQRARAIAHGSVFSTITTRSFDDLRAPDPKDPRLSPLEERLQPLLALVEQYVRESAALAATRDALLPLLMSGKIRVKDAEQMLTDDVASTLLGQEL